MSDTLLVPVAVCVSVALAVDDMVLEGLGRTVRDGEIIGRILLVLMLDLAVFDAMDSSLVTEPDVLIVLLAVTDGVGICNGVPEAVNVTVQLDVVLAELEMGVPVRDTVALGLSVPVSDEVDELLVVALDVVVLE